MPLAVRLTQLVCLIVLATSCARANRGSDGDAEPRSSSNRLIRADLMASGETNLYDAVERLRPRWLQVRGITSVQGSNPIIVYHDNARIGGVDVLRSIRIEGVQEIRFIRATDATTRWGIGHTSGAIEVVSVRNRRR